MDNLCECGCGGVTNVAKLTDSRRGNVKGQPQRFVLGHNSTEARARQGLANKARVFTPEIRAKMSAAKKGHTLTLEHRAKISTVNKGLNAGPAHWQWKGDDVGYGAFHTRVRKAWGYSHVCENCGSTGRTHWANLNHDYNWPLVREEWAELCSGCHIAHDAG